ncbi:MAG: transglycosylase SLT domain-containing protein [Ancalomicrobiaceae bacterium]|nr:transglycosylase SLT domain-containing protein [Ancalomicrobiaceae bacterium]
MIPHAKAGLLIAVALAGAIPPAYVLVQGWNSLWVKQDFAAAVLPAKPSQPPGVTNAAPSAAERLAAGFDAVARGTDAPAAQSGLDRYAETPLVPPPAAAVTVVSTHPSRPSQPALATAPALAKPLLPPVPPAPMQLAAVDPSLALASVEAPADPAEQAIVPQAPEETAALQPQAASLPPPPAPRVLPVAMPDAYRKLIEDEATADHLPVKLALAVVAVESDFKADKHGDDGKLGLFQLRYPIAKALGYKGTSAELLDPATNVKWGMKYLAGAYTRAGGDTCKTAMKFIGGHYQDEFKPIHAAYCQKLEDRMAALQ